MSGSKEVPDSAAGTRLVERRFRYPDPSPNKEVPMKVPVLRMAALAACFLAWSPLSAAAWQRPQNPLNKLG